MTPQQVEDYKVGWESTSPHDSDEVNTVYLRGARIRGGSQD